MTSLETPAIPGHRSRRHRLPRSAQVGSRPTAPFAGRHMNVERLRRRRRPPTSVFFPRRPGGPRPPP